MYILHDSKEPESILVALSLISEPMSVHEYSELIESTRKFFQKFDARWQFFHRIKESRRVLELGCGAGHNWRELQFLTTSIEYHGIDVFDPSQAPQGIVYVKLDLNNVTLPYADDSFDAIIFTHVIEHLTSPHALGREIHRVLKPGGIIYAETPNWTSMLVPSFGYYREQHNPFNFYDDPTHVRPWTKESLFDFLFTTADLHVERVATLRNWPRLPWDFIKFFYGWIIGNRQKMVVSFWNIYGWCIYAVGKKRQ